MFDKLFAKSADSDNPMSGMLIGICLAGAHMLMALLVIMILVFFQELMNLLPWVLGGFAVLIAGSAALIWVRLKKQGDELKEMLDNPIIRDRAFEVRLLGGVASMRVGPPTGNAILTTAREDHTAALEDPETVRRRELEKLVMMRQSELITQEEFEQLKAGLMQQQAVQPKTSSPSRPSPRRAPDIEVL